MKSKFGSVEWQKEIIDNIKEKDRNGEELNSFEKSFIKVQIEHQKRCSK